VRPVFSECQHQYDGKRQTGSSSWPEMCISCDKISYL
jgi:hypothetical protein